MGDPLYQFQHAPMDVEFLEQLLIRLEQKYANSASSDTSSDNPLPLLFSEQSHQTKPSVKVVFLDIDGVLYPYDSNKGKHRKCIGEEKFRQLQDRFDPMLRQHLGMSLRGFLKVSEFNQAAVRLLSNLVHEHDAKIVLSSDWRKGKSVEQIKQWLDLWGLGDRVIGMTKILEGYRIRGSEIKDWVQSSGFQVRHMVILDDQPFNISDFFPYNFVHTQATRGLTADDFDKALRTISKPLDRVVIEEAVKQSNGVLDHNWVVALKQKLSHMTDRDIAKAIAKTLHKLKLNDVTLPAVGRHRSFGRRLAAQTLCLNQQIKKLVIEEVDFAKGDLFYYYLKRLPNLEQLQVNHFKTKTTEKALIKLSRVKPKLLVVMDSTQDILEGMQDLSLATHGVCHRRNRAT